MNNDKKEKQWKENKGKWIWFMPGYPCLGHVGFMLGNGEHHWILESPSYADINLELPNNHALHGLLIKTNSAWFPRYSTSSWGVMFYRWFPRNFNVLRHLEYRERNRFNQYQVGAWILYFPLTCFFYLICSISFIWYVAILEEILYENLR